MSALQGLVSYPGLTTFTRASYTLSQGISPGKCVLEMPQELIDSLEPFGDLTFSYGDTSVTLFNCAVENAHIDQSQGGYIGRVTILDRRWQWKNERGGGSISGHYNVRMPSGTNADEGFNSQASQAPGDSTNIRTRTEMAPQDLANLCLVAMGEQNFDVSALPNDPRPEVDWSYANPAEALQSLCEGLGCRVVLNVAQNSVQVVAVGQGESLPDTGTQTFISVGLAPPIVPSSLQLVGGPCIFQGLIPLQAVGIDTNGQVKDIYDLSYQPDAGWSQTEPMNWTVFTDPETRALVEKSIYKMWRIALPIQVPSTTVGLVDQNGNPTQPTDIREIVLYDRLIETHFDSSDSTRIIPKTPVIYGTYNPGLAQVINTMPAQNPTSYRDKITVDADRWLIFTQDKLCITNANGYAPATLWIKIAYSVRDLTTWEPVRYARTRQLDSQAQTQARIIRREEIFVKIIGTYDPQSFQYTGATDNLQTDQIVQEADYWLDAAQQEYIEQDSLDVPYAGIVPIQPDGLIQQVTYEIVSGPGGSTKTRASLATEHNPYVLPWAARRRQEQDRFDKFLEKEIQRDFRNAVFRPGGF